jgi:erythromycin esterase
MWRNTVTAKFIEWLRDWNGRSGNERSQRGFFGMDLYSLHTSNPCSTISRELIPQHRGGLAIDMLALSISAMSHKRMVPRPSTMARKQCEDEVVSQLLELLQRDGHIAAEEFFSAEQMRASS